MVRSELLVCNFKQLKVAYLRPYLSWYVDSAGQGPPFELSGHDESPLFERGNFRRWHGSGK